MKTLSVRFYKRLILVILALLILIPMAASVALWAQNRELRSRLAGGAQVEQDPFGDPQKPLGEPLKYQLLYPELVSTAAIPEKWIRDTETVYLTFDCDPNSNTETILNILDEYGIKASFFVSGSTEPEAHNWMRAIVERGHTIGLRGYSTSYQQIYGANSIETFLDDFKAIYDLVYEVTGVRAEIFRYPGGSLNPYNCGVYQAMNAEMLRRNFVFFDWDVRAESALMGSSAEQIRDGVLAGMAGKDRGIIALQDMPGSEPLVAALPGIIEGLRDAGYQFQSLTPLIQPVIFSYKAAP